MKIYLVSIIIACVIAAFCWGFVYGRTCGAIFGHGVTPITCNSGK